ncbi:hypothetical protein P154DRAFT_522377 [Amniculicola lignicola CBS 123094]|uniref:Mediator of RNA polymerase II transcription subunit 12 n=1 Tax=Amniculicola lignicola CBS 123094 TaxID=1392246 RepID=A0A6A5WIE0_9PLEO|nr:hypothetical protein P154DRAFT_522377 [Amniculicola lignicola CBS 123094]
MTSRPGPGIQESLQHRGSAGPPRAQGHRRPSRPTNTPQYTQQNCIDPNLESSQTSAEEPPSKSRVPAANTRLKPVALDGIQTGASEGVRPPPRGKPQLFFNSLSSNASDLPLQSLQSPQAPPANTAINWPVPPRPGSSLPGNVAQPRRVIPGGLGVKDEAATKAPSIEPPAVSIVFPGGRTADLFPWTGNHPEDTLSEALVKGGISNKPQIMNETNTARPSLWTNLKNKSGLSTLSSLFVAVLEKRQSCGRLTTPNTFNPPPRLTLRDSTREQWLHDLANPTVGLRRLSRTIPHGITGKVLLEQCLNKNIPIPRALWLAKCVGINEMRSHKRKGQAGTLTWVRGWTSSVEQFLDSVATTIGQPDWKARITYSLQLAYHLYKDHLLEEEHYIDWLLRNLEVSQSERLFLWLLLASVYWTDLISSRRRGRRLAEALLDHSEKLSQLGDTNRSSPISEFLDKTIIRLLITCPVCYLLPKTWEKHGTILQSHVTIHPHPQASQIFADLDRRAKRLLRPLCSNPVGSRDPRRRIIHLLDNVDYSNHVNIESLAYDCMEAVADARKLLSTVLNWTSSLYRDGSHRIYLCTRLLRRWSHLGADIDDGILHHLHKLKPNGDSDIRNTFRVIAELVRSKTFSVGRYLQWLIATGLASGEKDLSTHSAWPLRLITEIPLAGLPEQILNLRRTLLGGTAYSVDDEERTLDDVEALIQQQAPSMCDTTFMYDNPVYANTVGLSATVQLELGIWIRSQVAANVEIMDRVPTKDPSVEESSPVCSLSVQDFHVARSYLEQFDDLSILADVIGLVATSLDSNVLTSAADTLHYHHKTLSAIGAFQPLFQKIAMRYAAIRTIRFPERELLGSLTELARVAKADSQLVQIIAYDFSRYELKNSMAACSPVSDTMVDVIHGGAIDTADEIDRILSSGTNMDQQIMMRVFAKVAQTLEEQVGKDTLQSEQHASWFYRLRSFDEIAFDKILADWLSSLLMSHKLKLLLAALPPLVTSICLTLSQFFDIYRQVKDKQSVNNPDMCFRICVAVLDALLPSDRLPDVYQSQYAYRYRLEQHKFCLDGEGSILQIIKDLIEYGSSQSSPALPDRLSGLLASNRVRKVVRHFAVNNPQLLSTLFGIGSQYPSQMMYSHMKRLVDGLLDPQRYLQLSTKTVEQQVSIVVDRVNSLSLPFCRLEIQLLLSGNIAQDDTSADVISGALLASIKAAVDKDESSWPELITSLGPGIRGKVREHAERELLNASSFLGTSPAPDIEALAKDSSPAIQEFLTVIDFTESKASDDSQATVIPILVDRLRGVGDAAARIDDLQKRQPPLESMSPLSSHLFSWLNVLLHLAIVHGSSPSTKALSQQHTSLLWTIRSLLPNAALAPFSSVVEYVFDVAILLSDSISGEVRDHLIRLESAKPADDPRCAFISGNLPTPDGWLALIRAVAAPAASQLQVSNSIGSQPYPNVAATPSPRPLSQQQQQQYQHLQGGTQNRAYPQYPQHNQQQSKLPPQLQRMASSSGPNLQQSQFQQMQQMQAMQGLAQQRSMAPSPVHMQRPPGPGTPGLGPRNMMGKDGKMVDSKIGGVADVKLEMRPVPFVVPRWEILPDGGREGGNGNETSVSLTLFGARRV